MSSSTNGVAMWLTSFTPRNCPQLHNLKLLLHDSAVKECYITWPASCCCSIDSFSCQVWKLAMSNSVIFLPLLIVSCIVAISYSESMTYTKNFSDSSTADELEHSCPTWNQFNRTSSTCECGSTVDGIVHCDRTSGETKIINCYCMSFSEELNSTVLGISPYVCFLCCKHQDLLYTVPTQPSKLDDVMCGQLNRTGQMCGSCQEGYAPPVYSYTFACVECSDYKYNWLKYLAVAYLPLTVFFLAVVLFRISVITPSLNVFVLFNQLVSTPLLLQLLFATPFKVTKEDHSTMIPSAVIEGVPLSMYAVWNLDFFRAFYEPFCLHPNTTTLHVVALDYLVAVYPLCLILLIAFLAKLHYYYIYRITVRLFAPFLRCFRQIRKEWNLSDSLVGAFATFILLSYVKILNVSFALLAPVVLYDINGVPLESRYLLYDGTVEWFGKEHLPFAILAIAMLLVFNILPLCLLTFYPCGCFNRCLNGTLAILVKYFMDVFQSQYKSKYARSFAGLYLAVRISNSFLLLIRDFLHLYLAMVGLEMMICAAIVLFVRPYKKTLHNIADAVALLTISYFAASSSLVITIAESHIGAMHGFTSFTLLMLSIYCGLLFTPLYGVGRLLYGLFPPKRLEKIKVTFKRVVQRLRRKRHDSDTNLDPVPHRLEHSDEYQPLLSNTKVDV